MNRDKIELAGTVTVGPKGQVVIPVDVRQKMGIDSGDKLIALYIPDKNAIGFVTNQSMQSLIDRMGKRIEVLRSRLGEME